MKEDAPMPAAVPRKRRQLEALLDRHIAIWLASDTLSRGDRKRLEEEKARRKTTPPARRVGIIAAAEGMTPEQLAGLRDVLAADRPTEVLHTRLPRRAHGWLVNTCRQFDTAPVLIDGDTELGARTVVRDADKIVALPRESEVQPYATPGVWARIGYAKHRGIPVMVVMPNGQIEGAGDG